MAITTNVPGATKQTTSFTNNGFSTDTLGGFNFPLQKGVPYQNLYTFKVIPAIDSDTCVASSQSWPGATTSYTLNTTNTVSGTQLLSTAFLYNGLPAIRLDCERSVSIKTTGTTTATIAVTISGLDYIGNPLQVVEGITAGFNGSIGLSAPISVITSITSSANPGVPLSFGNGGQRIGLPYFLSQLSYVTSCTWDTTAVSINSTNITVGTIWRQTPPISLLFTNTPRGYVTVPTDADGVRPLVITYLVSGSDSEMNGELANLNQSTLKLINANVAVAGNKPGFPTGQYIWPYLTQYDLVGMNYPGDLAAATIYNSYITT